MNCLCWDALTPWISQREAVVQRAPLLERSRWPHHFDACDGRGPSSCTENQRWLQRRMNEIKSESTNITWPTTMLLLLLQTCLLLRLYMTLWSGVLWYERFLNMISSRLDLSRYDSVGSNQGLMIETYWNQTITPQVPPPGVLESKFLPQEAHSQLRGCDAKAPGSMRRMAFKWDSGTCKENLTVLAKTGKL